MARLERTQDGDLLPDVSCVHMYISIFFTWISHYSNFSGHQQNKYLKSVLYFYDLVQECLSIYTSSFFKRNNEVQKEDGVCTVNKEHYRRKANLSSSPVSHQSMEHYHIIHRRFSQKHNPRSSVPDFGKDDIFILNFCSSISNDLD